MTNIETSITPNRAYVYSEDDFDGYSAAPLLIVGRRANRKLVESQDDLARKFVLLTRAELGSYVKPPIVDFVARSLVSRMHQREALNSNSYIRRSHRFPNYIALAKAGELFSGVPRKARYGKGNPISNDLARHAFGMDSIELANITVIGEARKDVESKMWDAVGELIGEDATPHADQMYGYQVLGFDRDIRTSSHIGAMRFGMKRFLGETKFGATAKVRSTLNVNLSPSSGFDPDLVDYFRETAIKGNPIGDLPEFESAAGWLIEAELPPGLVLARNETVYEAVIPKTKELV